ncbi:unnamed protein product [Paramecium sonneborni]|uniref:Uncharacterized protein n=1 Tax=Paramecium sonneborni TaxID=65129 RepID=A0A8S1QKH4_9CILI|nr:unnamed protein product [Paramecium sonneborni]
MKSQKSFSSNKTTSSNTSFILNTVQMASKHIQQPNFKTQQKSTSSSQIKKPYIMISPKLIEEFDQNKTKQTKLLFENRISLLQTTIQLKSDTQIPSSNGQILTSRVRKRTAPIRLSLRLPTQL